MSERVQACLDIFKPSSDIRLKRSLRKNKFTRTKFKFPIQQIIFYHIFSLNEELDLADHPKLSVYNQLLKLHILKQMTILNYN